MTLSLANYPILSQVLGWTILWLTLYKSSFNIIKNKKNEYNCRILTLLHAIIITTSSCFATFFNGFNPYTMLGLPNTHIQEFIMATTLGYFIYDFAWCLYNQTEDMVMLLHHVLSVTFISVGLFLGVSGTELVATIFGTEISSILLNIRWFMKEHHVYTGNRGLLIDLLFVTMFVIVRLGVGGSLIFSVWNCERSPLIIKIGGTCFYLVNYLFFIQIAKFTKYRIQKWYGLNPKSKKQKNVTETHKNGAVYANGNGNVSAKKKVS